MTTYYSIVDKSTGKMHEGHSNYIDHQERDLAPDLAYAELNNELVRLLVSTDPEDHEGLRPVDFKETTYDFLTNTWNIVYLEPGHQMLPHQEDPVENQENIRQQLIGKVRVYLDIPDISPKFREKLEQYITDIEAIELTEANASTTRWPDLPL